MNFISVPILFIMDIFGHISKRIVYNYKLSQAIIYLIKSKSNVNTPLITLPAADVISIRVLNAFI